MAGTPETIILDPAKPALERAEATKMRADMLQQSVGSVGKNIMDMVTQYQDLKIQKQKSDMASMTTAGAMVGGMDNLPQEAKNKLPGILGIPLPTNENGDVQITPDLDTLIKRSTIGLLQNDPDAAKILSGMQEKHTDPLKLASDQKIGEMRLAGTREKIAADAAKAAADNDTKIQQTIISGQYRTQAAGISAKGSTDAATIRANQVKSDQLPSPFVLDPKTNTLMSEPQWYSTYPDRQMPPKLSNADVKTISGQQKSAAAVAASNASAEANRARVDTAHFQLKKLISGKQNDAASKQLKLLVDSYRLSKGTEQEPHMKAMLEKEIPKILKQGGMSDEDLAPLTTAVGEGGWADAASNLFNSAYGYTSTDSKPSLLQPVVASIPGLHPSLVGTVAGFFRGKPKAAGTAQAATGQTYSGKDAEDYLNSK
jgi:hypothetical protein